MKKLSLLILLTSLLTGCIEITEKIHFNKDGSGNATISVKNLCSILLEKEYADMTEEEKSELEKMNGHLLFDSGPLKEKALALKEIEGIKNLDFEIKHNFNPEENDVSYVSFDFSSVETLNRALASLYNTDHVKDRLTNIIIQNKTGSKISRMGVSFFYGWDGHYNHFSGLFNQNDIKNYNATPEARKKFCFDKVNLSYDYSFDYEVKPSAINKLAKVSEDNKNVNWTVNQEALMTEPMLNVACSFTVIE